jgi:hypothetical protein
MSTSIGTSSDGSFPVTLVTTGNSAASTPSQQGTSGTFEDVLQQEEGGSSNPYQLKGKAQSTADKTSPPAATLSSTSTAPKTPATDPTVTSSATALAEESLPTPSDATTIAHQPVQAKTNSTTPPTGTNLSAWTAQAATLISKAQSLSGTQTTTAPTTTTSQETAQDSNAQTRSAKGTSTFAPGASEISTVVARALIMAYNATHTSVAKAASTPVVTTSSKITKDAAPETNSANGTPQMTPAVTDLATLLAQSAAAASTAQQSLISNSSSGFSSKTFVTAGKELPVSGSNKASSASTTAEKKSAAASSEGIFLQSDSSSASLGLSGFGLLASSITDTTNSVAGQSLTSQIGSVNSALSSISGNASALGGTANVEKEKAMNANFSFPEIFSGYAVNTPSRQTPADVNILLSSNNDFNDALKNVMHVAQLNQTNESRAPMRVAMEIQTPPGAVVNVYVSRQNDQWRAQLSTNDPQALSWVQDQMTSLRQSNDLGVEVKWLPPQMESTASSSTPDANLSWDRGGQGQSNYQQPDERQQPPRQNKPGVLPALAEVGANPFMNSLAALGRAA